jgi:hypothetical protein
MRYTGEQLDEADADLLLELIHHARAQALGETVTFSRVEILRAMGRHTGKADYLWLHRRMKALTVASLFIEALRPNGLLKYRVGTTEAFHIIQSFRYDEVTRKYSYVLDPSWNYLFENKEFSRIDWAARIGIQRGQDMAKALQRLIASSADIRQRYALAWLKELMQYSGRMRDFKAALRRAVAELKRLELVSEGAIELSSRKEEQLSLLITRLTHRDSIAPSSG